MRSENFVILLVLGSAWVAHSFSVSDLKAIPAGETARYKMPITEEDLEFLEPAIVPDPIDGSRWWYAPLRKPQYKRMSSVRKPQIGNKAQTIRLPRDVVPSIYNIRLLPFVEFIEDGNFTIDGYEEIHVDCVENTNAIVLNSLLITIDEKSITVLDKTNNNAEVKVEKLVDDQQNSQTVSIKLVDMLQKGRSYKVSMKFTAILGDDLGGFYRSSYLENGKRKWLAVSQFETTDARRAFPCFDEPNMKANFSITLGRKDTMTSASNMPQISSNPIDGLPGYSWDFYQTTPKMSTYLVAFLVSEFAYVVSEPGSTKFQSAIWTRPETQNLTGYANTIAPKILEWLAEYFDYEYQLPKEDSVAVPDFAAGAMENWGLITYREVYLQVDPISPSANAKQGAVTVIAHEEAHQWTGDLVTTGYWNNIWLNEGFAAYFEYLGADAVEPGFRLLDQFVIQNLQYIFQSDSLQTSRPIYMNESEVDNPSISGRLFDGITYEKGSCLLRMLSDIVGNETLRRGLIKYIKLHEYSNVYQDDLWQAIQNQVDTDDVSLPASVKEIMETWTTQMGYPVVTVTRNYDDNTAEVKQERFISRKTAGIDDPHLYRWWVHLTYTTSQDKSTIYDEWMSPEAESQKITIKGADKLQGVLFNVAQKNYYRVAYDDSNYWLLAQQLRNDHTLIPHDSRAQLLDDAFNLALAKLTPYKAALDMMLYLKNEKEYVPWNAVLSELSYVDNMLHNKLAHPDWKTCLTSLVQPYYESVGFEDSPSDAHLTIFSRIDAVEWACRLDLSDCVEKVLKEYAELMTDPNHQLSPNLRDVILRNGVAKGGEKEWDFAFSQYKLTGSTSYLIAMAKTQRADLIYRMLGLMVEPNGGINEAQVNTLFSNIASTSAGHPLALNFLEQRWAEIENSLGASHLVPFFRYVCDRSNEQSQLDRLNKLIEVHNETLGSSPTVQQGLDVVNFNIEWIDLHEEEITSWLADPDPTTTSATETSTASTVSSTTTEKTSTSSTTTTTMKSTTTSTKPTTTESTTTKSTTTPQSTTTKSTTTPQSTTTSKPSTKVTDEIPSTTDQPTTQSSQTTSSSTTIRPFHAILLLAAILIGRNVV